MRLAVRLAHDLDQCISLATVTLQKQGIASCVSPFRITLIVDCSCVIKGACRLTALGPFRNELPSPEQLSMSSFEMYLKIFPLGPLR